MKGSRGEDYNLCAGEVHEIRQLLQTAIHLSGVKVKIQSPPHLMRPSDENIILGSEKTSQTHRLEAHAVN